MFVASRLTDMSVYAMNIVTLEIGLGVAIDYSLFLVSRFREELKTQPSAGRCSPRPFGTGPFGASRRPSSTR